jgi:hypothetical protein
MARPALLVRTAASAILLTVSARLAATSRPRYLRHAREVPPPTTREGIVPGWFYIVRKKGVVEL